MSVALLTLALAAAGDPDPPAVSLPAEVQARPGRIVTLTAATAGKQLQWLTTADDADLVPLAGGKSAVFVSPTPGRYLVLAWTAAGDVPSPAARCWVVVGGPAPPADPLRAELKALVAADRGPDKLTHLAQLAAVYREAVQFADRPGVRTAAELADRIKVAVSALLPSDSLVSLRKRVAEEIAKQLPLDADKELDPTSRKAAADLFARIAAALEDAK